MRARIGERTEGMRVRGIHLFPKLFQGLSFPVAIEAITYPMGMKPRYPNHG